ncbi:hypothetical protein HDU91_005073 [Kappamyces sp. JEL0680]|nr:hypothetical protein HDU91_005073 [Kappamyces sp. JEL0680]
MYALVLFQSAKGSLEQTAYRHFQLAAKLVLRDLEAADPLAICTFLHLNKFKIECTDKDKNFFYHSLAIALCKYLGIDRDVAITWTSPIGNSLTNINFQRAMYFHLYRLDLNMALVRGGQPQIEASVMPSMYLDFQLPNLGDPCEMTQNSLSFSAYYMPLMEIVRSLLFEEADQGLDQARRRQFFVLLETWYASLPPLLCYSNGDIWKGRYASIISLQYYSTKLCLLREPFLNQLLAESGTAKHPLGHGSRESSVIKETVSTASQVTFIADCFVHATNRHPSDSKSAIAKHLYFFSGLFHASSLPLASSEKERKKIIEIIQLHCDAVALCYVSTRYQNYESQLGSCINSPGLALSLLKTNPFKIGSFRP